MSIENEVTRIENNVDDALAAVSEYGVEVASESNSDNLGTLIRAIPKANIVQTTGESTTDIMSQKAVTDAIAAEHDAVPDYWLPALQDGVEAINTALCGAGANKSAFLFYTDAHWTYSAQKSPALLKYLYRHTGMARTFFGGDIVGNEATDYDTMAYVWEWRRRLKELPNHHSVPGNHDDGNTTNHLFDKNYVYGYLLAAEESPDIVREGDGLYYYIDNPSEKTRYLFLDTACFGVDGVQQNFVKNALLTTPAKWHIVAVAHIWVNTDYTVSPPVPSDINAEADKLLTMFDAYNSRTGDYADCTGWVEFCIGGHTHWDYDTTSTMGIPIILTETDSQNVRSGLGFTAGTTTEASVSGIVADFDSRKIKVVRVGRGSSREVVMTWREITYTNQIPISTDASGAVYNGTGFKDGIRIGSDGTERTGAATDATGFIPCTKADTLYFSGCQITVGTGAYQEINYFDSNKAYLGKTSLNALTSDSASLWANVEMDENNYLTKYIMAGGYADTAFVRVTGDYIGAGSIITVNEEIAQDTPSYTNQIALSVAADGSEYVGANGEDGYSTGYRINFSGAEAAQEGMCCTGYIPTVAGQTIRLKNVTVSGAATAYLVEYKQDKTYKQVTALTTTLPDDGNGVYTGAAPLTGFIRISCGVIDDTSILTLDEEIV